MTDLSSSGIEFHKQLPMIMCCWLTRWMQYVRMLKICDEFATEFDMKFNSSKSVVTWIGDRCIPARRHPPYGWCQHSPARYLTLDDPDTVFLFSALQNFRLH